MARPRAPWRLALEDGEVMQEGGEQSDEQSDEQSQQDGRGRYQPSAQISNADRRFGVSDRDSLAIRSVALGP